MNPEIEKLKRQVADLEKKYNSLLTTSSIPFEVEKSFAGRGFVITGEIGTPPGEWYLNSGFVNGNPDVQSAAIRYLEYKNLAGQRWYIPLYTWNEM